MSLPAFELSVDRSLPLPLSATLVELFELSLPLSATLVELFELSVIELFELSLPLSATFVELFELSVVELLELSLPLSATAVELSELSFAESATLVELFELSLPLSDTLVDRSLPLPLSATLVELFELSLPESATLVELFELSLPLSATAVELSELSLAESAVFVELLELSLPLSATLVDRSLPLPLSATLVELFDWSVVAEELLLAAVWPAPAVFVVSCAMAMDGAAINSAATEQERKSWVFIGHPSMNYATPAVAPNRRRYGRDGAAPGSARWKHPPYPAVALPQLGRIAPPRSSTSRPPIWGGDRTDQIRVARLFGAARTALFSSNATSSA